VAVSGAEELRVDRAVGEDVDGGDDVPVILAPGGGGVVEVGVVAGVLHRRVPVENVRLPAAVHARLEWAGGGGWGVAGLTGAQPRRGHRGRMLSQTRLHRGPHWEAWKGPALRWVHTVVTGEPAEL
jgi:hypothetical protein